MKVLNSFLLVVLMTTLLVSCCDKKCNQKKNDSDLSSPSLDSLNSEINMRRSKVNYLLASFHSEADSIASLGPLKKKYELFDKKMEYAHALEKECSPLYLLVIQLGKENDSSFCNPVERFYWSAYKRLNDSHNKAEDKFNRIMIN